MFYYKVTFLTFCLISSSDLSIELCVRWSEEPVYVGDGVRILYTCGPWSHDGPVSCT